MFTYDMKDNNIFGFLCKDLVGEKQTFSASIDKFLIIELSSPYAPPLHISFLLPEVLHDTKRMLGVAESVPVEASLLQVHVLSRF